MHMLSFFCNGLHGLPTLAAVSIPVCTRLPRFARAGRRSEKRWLSRRQPLPRAGLRSGTWRRGICEATIVPHLANQGNELPNNGEAATCSRQAKRFASCLNGCG